MLTVLADALMTATRNDQPNDGFWKGRFQPPDRKDAQNGRRYRYNVMRDLW